MAQTVLLKRSSVAGNVPGSSDLALGEIAVNTADGAVYIKKGNNDIVAVADNDILHIDTTNSRIGIGTTSPSNSLHVNSGTDDWPIRAQSTDAKTGIIIQDTNTTNYLISESYTLSIGNQASLHASNLNIKSTGNVGIGTTSPDAPLHISAATEPYIRIENTDTILTEGQVVGGLAFEQNDSTGGGTGITGRIQMRSADRPDNGSYFGNVADMDFLVSGAITGVASDNATKTAMTIRAGTGSVGIGTTSPGEKLTVSGNTLTYGSTGNVGAGASYFLGNSQNSRDIALTRVGSATLAIGYYSSGWQESARFDSSGNLLVGTTSAANASAGFRAYAGGNGAFTRASTVLDLNRLSTDGVILNFQKDTASVGSIGAAAGNLYIVSNDVGLNFAGGGDGIYPATTNGGQRDAAIDLGASTHRFKDLYLSGHLKTGGGGSNSTGEIEFVADSTRARIVGGYQSGGGGYLKFHTDTTGGSDLERMIINSSGNVGIGTSSPTEKLHIHAGGIHSTPVTYAANQDNWGLKLGASNNAGWDFAGIKLRVDSTGSPRMALMSAGSLETISLWGGKVGIGTVSPARKLEVDFTGSTIGARFTRSDTTGSSTIEFANSAGVKSVIGFNAGNNNFDIQNGGAVRLAVSNTGAITFNNAFTFPTADGSANQVLQTDGSGNLTFGTAAGGGVSISNNVNNRVLTGDGTNANAEANLLFNGSTLTITGTTVSTGQITTGYGLTLTGGNTNFLLYNNTNDNLLYMRDTTNGQMLTTWYTNKFYVNKILDVNGDIQKGGTTVIDSSRNLTNIGTISSGAITSSGRIKTTNGLFQADEDSQKFRQYHIDALSGGASFLLGKLEDSGSTDGAVEGVVRFAYDFGSTSDNCAIHFNFAQRSGTARGTWWYEHDDQDGSADRVHVRLIDDGAGNMYVWVTCADYAETFIEANWRQGASIADSGTLSSGTLTTGTTLFDTANDPTAEMHIGKLYPHDDIYLPDTKGVYFGAGNDLQLYHNGSHSLITNQTGDLYIRNQTNDGDILFQADDGSGGDATYLTLDGANVQMIASQKLAFNDNVRATFGNSSDLQIYHDGTHSYMNSSTGSLYLRTGNTFQIENQTGSEDLATFAVNGAVTLYYDNSAKVMTTTDGIQVTSSNADNLAGPVITFNRDSASPADSDYLGQLKFKGENDADQDTVFAKITAKAADVSDGTEDGAIEFSLKKAGSNNINARFSADNLDLINGTGLTVAGNTTISGNLTVNGTTVTNSATNTTIEDALIELGSGTTGANSNDLGLILERGTSGNNAFIGFDESDDQVVFALTTATGSSTGNVAFSSFLPIKAAGITGTSLDINGNADISGVLTMSNTTAGSMLNMNNNSIIGVNAIQMADPGPNEGVSWSNIKIYESPDNLTTNSAGNFQVVYGSTRRFTVNNVGADVNGELLVNGANNNGGRADFAVDAGGAHSQLSLYGAQIQAGGTDMNYNAKFFHDANGGQIAVWDNNLTFTTQGSNTGSASARDIIFKPQVSGTAVPTERMRIKGDGNVGIGTSSPGHRLHVSTTNTIPLKLSGTSTSGTGIYIDNDRTGSKLFGILVGNVAAGAFSIKDEDAGATRFVIDSSGNVGIGTTSLTNKFHVSGDARVEGNFMSGGASATNVPGRAIHIKSSGSNAALRIEDTTSSNQIWDLRSTQGTGLLFIDETAGATRMTIKTNGTIEHGALTSGNVTINIPDGGGAPANTAILHLKGYEGRGAGIRIQDSVNSASGASNREWFVGSPYSPASNFAIGYASDGVQSSYSAQSALVINTNRQVGIGTTSPAYKLHVKETGTNAGAINVEDGTSWLRLVPNLGGSGFNPMSVAGDIGLIFSNDNDSSTNSSTLGLLIAPHSTSASGIKILEDGRVGIGTTTPNSRFTVNTTTTGDGIELQSSEVSIAKLSRAVVDSTVVASLDGVSGRPIHIGGVVNEDVILANGGGNVGIGTAAPSTKLNVNSGTDNTIALFQSTDSLGRLIIKDSAGEVHLNNVGNDFSIRTSGAGNTRLTIKGDTGNVGIGEASPLAKLQVEEYGVDTTSTSSTATTQIAIHSFAAADFRSARFTVQVTNSTDSAYHTTELLLVHNGTTANITEFGEIHTGSAVEATFDADISSGNVRLLATPASTDTMAFKVVCHSITT